MGKRKHEFLPRNHLAEYGDLDKSNWKDLRVNSNWKFIDPAIQGLLRLLNQSGFTTFSSCSGGHRRNLNQSNSDHEGGYISFFPPSGITYKLYFALRKKYRHFVFDVVTNTRNGSKWVESTELDWQLQRNRASKRAYYYEIFEDMAKIVRGLKPTEKSLLFSQLAKHYNS